MSDSNIGQYQENGDESATIQCYQVPNIQQKSMSPPPQIKSIKENSSIIKQQILQNKQSNDNSYIKQYKQFFLKQIQFFSQLELRKDILKEYNIRCIDKIQIDKDPRSYGRHTINVCHVLNQGKIVIYDVLIARFWLRIMLLNQNENAKFISEQLGKGGYGSVLKDKFHEKQFALKRIYFASQQENSQDNMSLLIRKSKIQEVIVQYAIFKICSALKIGPSIITQLKFDLVCYDDCIQFYMELCNPDFDIKNIQQFNKLVNNLKQSVFQMHMLNIIHKDIKPDNILYSKIYDKYVLSDFGISHSIIENVGQKSFTYTEGTLKFMIEQMKDLPTTGGFINLYENDIQCLSHTFNTLKAQMGKHIQHKKSKGNNNRKLSENYILPFQVQEYDIHNVIYILSKLQINTCQREQLHMLLTKMKSKQLNKIFQFIRSEDLEQRRKKLEGILIQQKIMQKFQLHLELALQNKQLNRIRNLVRVFDWTQQLLAEFQKYQPTESAKLKKILKNKRNKRFKENNEFKYIFLGNNNAYINLIMHKIDKYSGQAQYGDFVFQLYLKLLFYHLHQYSLSSQQQILQKLKVLIIKNDCNKLLLTLLNQINTFQKSDSTDYQPIMDRIDQIEKTKKYHAVWIYLKLIKILRQKNQLKQILCVLEKIRFNNNIITEIYYFYEMSSIHNQLEQYQKALNYILITMKLAIENYCEYHPLTRNVYCMIGSIYRSLGQPNKALQYCEKALSSSDLNKINLYDNVLNCYLLKANINFDLKNYEVAIEYAFKALNFIQNFQNTQNRLSLCYQIISKSYYMTNNNIQALEFVAKSKEINKKIYPTANKYLAHDHQLQAEIRMHMSQYDRAQQLLNESFDILIKINQNSISIGALYYIYGCFYILKQDYLKGKQYLQKSIAIYKLRKIDGRRVIEIQNLLAKSLSNLGDHEASTQIILKNKTLYELYYGLKNHVYWNFIINCVEIYRDCKLYTKAEQYLNHYQKHYQNYLGGNISESRIDLPRMYLRFSQIYVLTNRFTEAKHYFYKYIKLKPLMCHDNIQEFGKNFYYLYKIQDQQKQSLRTYTYLIICYSIFRRQSTRSEHLKRQLESKLKLYKQKKYTYPNKFKKLDNLLIKNIKSELKKMSRKDIIKSLFIHKLKLKYRKFHLSGNNLVLILVEIHLHYKFLNLDREQKRYLIKIKQQLKQVEKIQIYNSMECQAILNQLQNKQ